VTEGANAVDGVGILFGGRLFDVCWGIGKLSGAEVGVEKDVEFVVLSLDIEDG
jgi:hypothetical protein